MANPTVQATMELAARHARAGQVLEAEALYRQVLNQQQDHAEALHALGIIALQRRQPQIARELILRALTAHPRYAEAYTNLGNVLVLLGEINQAIEAYRRALDINPNLPEAHSNLGNLLRKQQKLDEAIACFRRAIILRPDFAEAHSNLGNALKDDAQLTASIAAYKQAISLSPHHAETHYNLGIALELNNEIDHAVAAYQTAIRLNPQSAKAHNNLGMAWKTMGQLDQAIASYRRALQIDPAYTFAHSNLIYSLQMHPAFSAQAIHHEAVRWDQRQAEPVRPLILPHSADPDPDRSLRIGYVSADFRDHVVGRNLMPLLRNHDRQRFQIICYSSVADPDWMTAGLRKHADHWRNICGLSDQELISLIRDDQVDVLVDLSLHTAGNRLRAFAGKPSSVQVTFAGYPGTTGLSAIDYRLSDPYLDPPGMDESVYTERTIRLPHSFWCYDPLECADISVSALPASKTGTITFGCLNSFCKINDGVLALWSQVLRRVPSSRILLLATEGSHRQRTIDRLGQAEIAPGRIEFAAPSPRRKYMELYHRIDIGLDCFPYNGHTTSLDSFWMGVPVVTLVGSTVVGRAGWCHLSNLGLVELAAQTPDQFVQKTAALAQDLPRLEELRLTLRERMQRSPLMDAPKFARDIEAAYRQMWRAWCASPKLKNA